jgi:hypothetical protein
MVYMSYFPVRWEKELNFQQRQCQPLCLISLKCIYFKFICIIFFSVYVKAKPWFILFLNLFQNLYTKFQVSVENQMIEVVWTSCGIANQIFHCVATKCTIWIEYSFEIVYRFPILFHKKTVICLDFFHLIACHIYYTNISC